MRGKTRSPARRQSPAAGFNEAPAECGGKLENPLDADALPIDASMRPPQNAGENDIFRRAMCAPVCASMRPPQNAGENAGVVAPSLQDSSALQ